MQTNRDGERVLMDGRAHHVRVIAGVARPTACREGDEQRASHNGDQHCDELTGGILAEKFLRYCKSGRFTLKGTI